MMTRHLSILFYYHRRYHQNTPDQTQWIEEKWDLTLQMIRLHRMLYHPVWLIEVEEDLLIIQFLTPTNQGEWWCATHPFPPFLIIISTETRRASFNGPNRRDVWYFKSCSHSECSFTQFNWVQLRKIYSLFPDTVHASQCERLCSAHVSLVIVTIVVVFFRMTTETPLTKVNVLKRS